jgi:hypothetical protein
MSASFIESQLTAVLGVNVSRGIELKYARDRWASALFKPLRRGVDFRVERER